MKLIQLGKKNWTVLAVCDRRDDCPVLDHLLDRHNISAPGVLRMLYRLKQALPENGPELYNSEKAKHLREGIFEVKEQPKKGPKPRVIFFYDEKNIVCTESFEKRGEDLTDYIDRALELKRQYFESKARGTIEIEVPE